jgi:curved DNA-binding protein CbpA
VLRSYRKKVKRLHPDRGGDQRRFLLLQADFEQSLQYVREQSGRANNG